MRSARSDGSQVAGSRVRWLGWMMAVLASVQAVAKAREPDAVPAELFFVGLRADAWHFYRGKADGGLEQIEVQSEPRTPAYSGSHGRIAYISAAGDLRELELSTGKDRVLLAHGAHGPAFAQPVYRPGSVDLYFVQLQQGASLETDIVRLDRRGARVVPVVTQRSAQFEPAFTLDGTAILYSSIVCGPECSNLIQELFRMELSSGRVEQRTVLGATARQVAAGPEHRLVFASNRGGHYQLWQAHGEAAPAPLTTGEAIVENPVIGDQGEIYFIERAAGRSQLMRLREGEAPTPMRLPLAITELRDLRWGR